MSGNKIHNFAELFRQAHMEPDGTIWHADGSASYAWLTHPLSAEHLSGTERDKIADQIGKTIALMPAGTTVQFLITNLPQVGWILNNYLQQGGTKNPWIHQHEMAKAKAFQDWSVSLESVVGAKVNVKDIQVMVVLTVYMNEDDSSDQMWKDLKDSLSAEQKAKIDKQKKAQPSGANGKVAKKPERDPLGPIKMLKAHKRAQEEVFGLKQTLMTQVERFNKLFQHNIGLPAVPCKRTTYIRFIRTLIDPSTGPYDPVQEDDELFLPEQVCRGTVEFTRQGKYAVCNGLHQGMLWTESWPKHYYAGMLSMQNGQLEQNISPIDLLKNGVIAVNIRVCEKQETLVWLDRKQKLARGGSSDKVEEREVFEDSDECRDWIKNKNRRFVDVSLTCKMVGTSEYDCLQRLREMQNTFQALGFTMHVEDHDVMTLWSQQLPGGYTGQLDGSLRSRRRRDDIVGALAPIYMCGRGGKRFAYMGMNTHFEPYAFNPFDHPRSFNVAYLGESGSGKSVRIADVVTDLARSDNMKAFFIDYGGSFVSTIQLAGDEGLDVVQSLTNKDANNIFAGPAETCIPMLLEWIPNLALNENEPIDPLLKAKIERALKAAYRSKLHSGKPYRDFVEITSRYADYYPTNVRKRLILEFLKPDQWAQVQQTLRGDEANRPRFKVFYVVWIDHFTSEHGHTTAISEIAGLDETALGYLQDEYPYIESNEQGVYILTDQSTSVANLASKGFGVRLEPGYMIAEVMREADLSVLLQSGARVKFPQDWRDAKRREIESVLLKRFDRGTQEFDRALADDMERLPAQEYFASIDGLVDLQDEVVFSDYIRESKLINDPKLNDFNERLSLWYGTGIYAPIFDRRGGPDLKKYRLVNWDFKPLINANADKRLVLALIGAVATRIMVYCDSVTTMSERKVVVVDEFHEFRKLGPLVPKIVDRITLQARKNNYAAFVGTQRFEHLRDEKLLHQFQHFMIGSQLTASVVAMAKEFEWQGEESFIASQAALLPGRYSDFLLYIPATGVCEILRSVQTSFEYWLRTTHAPERTLRLDKTRIYNRDHGLPLNKATLRAVLDCAKEYPRGMRAAEQINLE